MKFHLDENVAHAIAHGLRRHGIDVTTSTEVGLLQADDEDQLSFAYAQGRVLVTQDEDYLAMNHQGIPHAGIAFWKPNSRSIGQVIRSLIDLEKELLPEEMAGRVVWI